MKTLTKQTILLFWQHAMKYRLIWTVITLSVLASVAIDLAKPFLIRNLFNALSTSGNNQEHAVLMAIFGILFIEIVHNLNWRIFGFTNNYFQPRVMSDLVNTCYRYLQNHSNAFFDNNFVGSMVAKVGRFSRAFENFMDVMYFNIARTALKVMAIVVIMLVYKPMIGIALLVWVIIYVGFAVALSKYKLPTDIQKSAQDSVVSGYLADTMTNQMNIKLFSSYWNEVKAFEMITEKLFRLRKKSWDLAQIGDTFAGFSMVAIEFVALYLAYVYWQRGALTIGDFAMLQSYIGEMFHQLWDIGRYIRTTYEAIADGNEMTELLLKPHEVVDKPHAKKLKVVKGAINFNKVSFHYFADQPVLTNFSLSIEPGERVALVGRSGGGKTTTVKTLFRFLDIQGGKIEVDGQDISKVTQASLRSQISLVPQDPMLFHRSLMDNIRYGRPDATDDEVIAAAKAAHCHEFIIACEQGYQTLVGERGVKLSGGERQRVAIARAILKNAPILVLDEATSSLDSESETLIQDALETLMKGKTTIVIAHRLSTIRKMDRIVVIDDGKIIEQGKHEELLKAEKGTYQKLWDIQVGGFNENQQAATA